MDDLLTYGLERKRDPPTTGPGRRVAVLLPVMLDATYHYRLPAELNAPTGTFVIVPFGRTERLGVIWDGPVEKAGRAPIAAERLKSIVARLDLPALPSVSMRFAEWMARYTLTPLGQVLRMMMSAREAFAPRRPRMGVRLAGPAPERMTAARKRVLEVAMDGLVRARRALAGEAGVGPSVVSGLVETGTLVTVAIPDCPPAVPEPAYIQPAFTESQSEAAHAMRAAVDGQGFSVTLLDGVTGSGKTEVYFEAVARALEQGRQVLILLPEISLTGQFTASFAVRFGCPPLEWHSALGAAQRGRVWRQVGSGEARVVVGARSALFLPFADLGLVIVDEEHDAGFKQEDRVSYQARDMAVVRGSLGACSVILASATPSIESHVNARSGRYGHVRLEERYSGQALPEITAIDLRKHAPETGKWLSPPLIAAMKETLEASRQSLLFLNRRGYAPLTLCRACGYRLACPQCTAWLVEHRFRLALTCHHCGFSLAAPEHCPKCGEEGTLVACGPGIERVAEEVRARFPEARLAMLSSDLVPGLMALRAMLADITAGEVDIVIGTQMVAKGHHFPGLALVGVVDGDLGLGQADPRAAERTFQLLQQVTGRAGRAGPQGRGLVQTYLPEHPVMQAIISGDREAFLEREIAARQAAMMPPYGRLAALIISAKQRESAAGYARTVALKAPAAQRIEVLGPAEAPLAVIRGRHRFRILVKAPRESDLQAYLRAWLALVPKAKGDLRLAVDIDPYSFL